MKKRNVWIAEELYIEIKYAQENLKRSKGKKRVTMLDATKRIGKHLNTLRTNKLYEKND